MKSSVGILEILVLMLSRNAAVQDLEELLVRSFRIIIGRISNMGCNLSLMGIGPFDFQVE